MIFRPDIRPPMWGPPDAIQRAIFENAGRIFGDPGLLKAVVPFWEGGGISVSDQTTNGNNLSTTSPLWVVNGYRCGTANKWNAGKTLSSILGSTSSKYTVISSVGVVARPTVSNFFLGNFQDGGTGYDLGLYQSSSTNVISWYYKSGVAVGLSGGAVTNGAEIMCGATWDGTTVSGYYQGRFSNSAAHTAAMGATQTFKAGGQWSGGNGTFDHRLLIIVADALTADQMLQFYATPYALVMPVSRPVYSIPATGNTNSSADPGNIAISGTSATGVKTSVSSANSGTVSIAGSVASGIRSLVSLATAASIAIAGFPAEGVYTPTGSTVSSAGPGIVSISGAPATGVQTHITSADPGTIVITGSDANAATGYASIAGPGTVAITGADAVATKTYVATASPTAIAITGSPAYATKSGGSSTSSGISLIFGKVILHL